MNDGRSSTKFQIDVRSEIGKLEGVILHTPGTELEKMTPENAERALYSDILNLSVSHKEYIQFSEVLKLHTKTFQVKDLLIDILGSEQVKESLVNKVCKNEGAYEIKHYLMGLEKEELAKQLLEGVPINRNTLSNYLSDERFSLRPLHNFFFTRDASVTVYDDVLICRMASKVRERESIIMEAIFNHNSFFDTRTVNPMNSIFCTPDVTIEGGDVLVARDDILCIGIGERTTPKGIDFFLEHLKKDKRRMHIIVQELPRSPESFIHLDMVFTFLDVDKCMVYSPVILEQNKLQTVHITLDNGEVESIENEENILQSLKKLGMYMNPVYCGGREDLWTQEREQWHSGANFFAMAPGKVLGYDRNVYTIKEMAKSGFEILNAKDIIKGRINIDDYSKYMVTIEGSELARGGGGCRCMTMPVKRKSVEW